MGTDKIRKYLILNIPYLFILWAFLKLGTAYRLAAGNDFAHKLIGLGQTIGPAFADFAPGLVPLDWLVGIVGAVGFRLLIYFKSKNAKKFRRDAEYGSARWGTGKDIKPFVDMISGMEVKEDDEDFMNAVDYMFAGLEKRKPDCFAVKQYKKYKLASGKTAKSILISCGARLAPFDIPQLREVMAYDELELDRIGDRKTAVFFIISDTTQTYNFLVALAFSQMFNLLCERADNVHGGRLPHHVRVLWDEAANTGQVPQLEKLVAVIRSREVSLVLLYQQLAQCKAIYDKHAETILGNMDSVVFLGGREASTIKEISENWLGKATISMQTEGRSRGQSESYNQNTQRLGRELMTPSELATMPGDKCILQLRGLPPFFSKKYDLKQHPNYRYTAEADKTKNAFDLDKLINRRRRPGLNEVCEVYEAAVPEDALTAEDEDILSYDDIDDPDAFV